MSCAYQQAHNPVLATNPPHSIGDVSSFVYDDHNDSYYATIKMFFAVNTSANYTGLRRSVGVSATKVSTRWPQPTPALTADDVDDRAWGADTAAARATGNRTELYGLSAFAYQSQYIGLLWVAHFNGKTVRELGNTRLPCIDLFPTPFPAVPSIAFGPSHSGRLPSGRHDRCRARELEGRLQLAPGRPCAAHRRAAEADPAGPGGMGRNDGAHLDPPAHGGGRPHAAALLPG